MVIHAGKSSNFGHYYSIARDQRDSWWLLNDAEVSEIKKDPQGADASILTFLDRLSKQFPSDTPYMLIYESGSPAEPRPKIADSLRDYIQ